MKLSKQKTISDLFCLPIFVVDGWGQILDVEFGCMTNLGVTEFDDVTDDEELAIIGCTSVKRFLDKKDDCFRVLWSFTLEKSFVDDINVWIFGDVVLGDINVTKDDGDDDDVPIEFVGCELNI